MMIPTIRKQTTWKEIHRFTFENALNAMPTAYECNYGFLGGEAFSSRTCEVSAYERPTFSAFIEEPWGYFQCTEPLTVQEYIEVWPGRLTVLAAQPA